MPDPEAEPQPTYPDSDPWQPAWWLLAFAPLLWLLATAFVLDRRGLPTALAALALLAPIGMPSPRVLRRLRRHPA